MFDKLKHKRKVDVTIPKFKLETTIPLNDPLKKLGMTDMFEAANFHGISDTPLYVSTVIQKAFIEVDEVGTTAAAATALGRKKMSRRPQLPEFKADHPFLFHLRDLQTGMLLFQGRVTDPSTS